MRLHTIHTIRELLQSEWESDLPDRVLAALRPFDGKPITVRLLKALPDIPDGWRLRREYGMTNIVSWEYSRWSGSSPAKHSISLLLCHTEASVPLDLREMVERNPAYFSARVARNHKRMEAMNNRPLLERMAQTMNQVEYSIAALQTVIDVFESLTAYDEPFNPDRFDLMRACGLMDAKGRYLLDNTYSDRAPEPTHDSDGNALQGDSDAR